MIPSKTVREKAKRIQATVKFLGHNPQGGEVYGVQGDTGYHHVFVLRDDNKVIRCDCHSMTLCSHRLAVLRYRAAQRGASLVAFTRNEKHTVSFARALRANPRFVDVAAKTVGGIYWVEAKRKAA